MKLIKGITLGTIFGIVLSFCISFMFMQAVQGLAGGFTSLFGERWIYYATIFPFVITFVMLGYYFTKKENITNKKLWVLSLLSALFITLYSGTIGAIFGEYIVRGGSLRTNIDGGFTGVNVEDTLVWGTTYAFFLLPITTPLARLIIYAFIGFLKKCK
ncbi:ABC transporter permease family protein [Cytobacillus massiliigabonensis]|uniref:hypothetical protein n=1 Tax=Cytobacillus massiliigabonensis TaxID=1871011 RepID=UPI000C829978|nr:hypothetical protein [Cytobacillus massiliigabonensis]